MCDYCAFFDSTFHFNFLHFRIQFVKKKTFVGTFFLISLVCCVSNSVIRLFEKKTFTSLHYARICTQAHTDTDTDTHTKKESRRNAHTNSRLQTKRKNSLLFIYVVSFFTRSNYAKKNLNQFFSLFQCVCVCSFFLSFPNGIFGRFWI